MLRPSVRAGMEAQVVKAEDGSGPWKLERRGAVVVATYAAPPMSYFTDSALEQLNDLIDGWSADESRAIVITGGVPGRFITHFDVDQILRNQQHGDPLFDAPVRSRRVQAVLRRLAGLAQPVIAALNGDAMGFGFELALAADLRIAQRGDHRIGLPEIRLGLIPSGSGLTRLGKLVGIARSLDLILRGRVLTPEEALDAGLVTELADDALRAALALAGRLAALPAIAIAVAKKALYQVADLPLDLALAFETESSFRLKQSPEITAPMQEYLSLPLEQRRGWLDAERRAWEAIEEGHDGTSVQR